jgi:RNA polymerase sigma-70 factor (ECF subfamily)
MTTEGKQEQFLELLKPVYRRLWRFALVTAGNHADAQDLMSETILATYERFHTVRDAKAFVSFLFTVATRIHRHKTRRSRWFDSYDHERASALHSTEASPEVAAEICVLLESIDKLPTKQREAVVLFEISGFSLEDIREIQGGTLSGVKSRLRRGREALAELLGVEHEDGFLRAKADAARLKEQESPTQMPQILSFAINE